MVRSTFRNRPPSLSPRSLKRNACSSRYRNRWNGSTETYARLKNVLTSTPDHHQANAGLLIRPVALKQSHDRSLAHRPGALDLLGALALVHEASASTDERLVGLDVASKLVEAPALHGRANPVQH